MEKERDRYTLVLFGRMIVKSFRIMIISFQLYALLSISLVSSVVAKSWIATHDVFEMWISLFDNRVSMLLLLNLGVVILFQIGRSLQQFFLGTMVNSELQMASDNIKRVVLTVISILLLRAANMEPAHVIQIPFPLFLRYLAFLIRAKLGGISLTQSMNAKSVHKRLFIVQTLSLIFAFQLSISYFKTHKIEKDGLSLILTIELAEAFIDILEDFVKHVILICDIESNGASMRTFKANFLCELFSHIMHMIISIAYFSSGNIIENLIFTGMEIPRLLSGVIKRVVRFLEWKKLVNIVETQLEAPSGEELTNTCIICRQQITAEDSRKLPCNHVYHTNCLIRWVSEHTNCALCQYDLSQLVKPHRDMIYDHTMIPDEEGLPDVPVEEFDFNDFTDILEAAQPAHPDQEPEPEPEPEPETEPELELELEQLETPLIIPQQEEVLVREEEPVAEMHTEIESDDDFDEILRRIEACQNELALLRTLVEKKRRRL